jgi:hypothetical protein
MVRENLKSEENRLKTFITNGWPKPEINQGALAANGFYYTGIEDMTKCAFCNLFVCCWTPDCNPQDLHWVCMRDCVMVTGKECDNIPIQRPLPPVFEQKPGGVDVCGLR